MEKWSPAQSDGPKAIKGRNSTHEHFRDFGRFRWNKNQSEQKEHRKAGIISQPEKHWKQKPQLKEK